MKHPSLESTPAPAASIPPVVTTVLRSSAGARRRGSVPVGHDGRASREHARAVRADRPTPVPPVNVAAPPETHAGHLHAYVDEDTRLLVHVEFHAHGLSCPDSEPTRGRPQRIHTDMTAAYLALVLPKRGAS